MGWETRNGKQYYYRKVRVGGRVRSVYCGTGERARLAAMEDERRRAGVCGVAQTELVEVGRKKGERLDQLEQLGTKKENEFAQPMHGISELGEVGRKKGADSGRASEIYSEEFRTALAELIAKHRVPQ